MFKTVIQFIKSMFDFSYELIFIAIVFSPYFTNTALLLLILMNQ